MQKNNKKMYLTIIGILLLICLTVAVSYAVWRIFLVQNNSSKLATSCFKVSLTDQDAINLVDTIPITDSDGAALTPYTFTITNACDSYAAYQVNLELLNTTTMTNMSAIKVMFDDETPSLLTTKETTEKTLTNASTAYKLKTSYLDKKATATHKLRLWIDEAVDMNTEGVQNLKLEAKVTVTASYAKELPTAVEYITTLAQTDTTNLATDDYGNIRYIGKNPNNYVRVEGEEYTSDVYYGYSSSTSTSYKEYSSLEECTNASSYNVNCKVGKAKGTPILWRIIGVMKDIDDGTGNKEDRVKLIRASSIGYYSWDTSESSVNNGYGVNEWSGADLMKLLNPGYESETVGGSLYWNNQSGKCYYSNNNGTTSCNFTSTGIKDKLKTLISDAVWNTGSQGTNDYTSASGGLTKHFYAYERSSNTGKICSSGDYCNDKVERTTTWKGLVGLMYPSDYGYATSGGDTTDRTTCLNTSLSSWDGSSVSDCKNNDWLFNSRRGQWTISPRASSSVAYLAFYVYSGGGVGDDLAFINYAARPVVYLTSNVKISGGEGTSESPFSLEL